MTTPKLNNLISKLSTELPQRPVTSTIAWRYAAIVASGVMSLLCLIYGLGLRTDLMQIWTTPPFILKILFGLSAFVTGGLLLRRSWQPRLEQIRFTPIWLVLITLVVAGAVGKALPSADSNFLPGWACALSIVGLSLPLMLSLTCLSRLYASTSASNTADAAALAACGIAIVLFALHCPYSQTPFILFWYGLGLIGSMALGHTILQRLLRW